MKQPPAKASRRQRTEKTRLPPVESRDGAALAPPVLCVLPVRAIRANPQQPRRSFDEATISRLADSLCVRGALQPVLVRPIAPRDQRVHDGGNSQPDEDGIAYELIAGERRWRAAQVAGLAEIPAIIRDVADDELLELALIENQHRENLNPIEKARAYRALHERGLSYAAIGLRTGEDRKTVAHSIRLLQLGETALGLVESGVLSAWHGKVLMGVVDKAAQAELARQAADKGWPVRQLQAAIKRCDARDSARSHAVSEHPESALLERVASLLQIKVMGRIRPDRPQCGSIHLQYGTMEQRDRVFEWLRRAVEP